MAYKGIKKCNKNIDDVILATVDVNENIIFYDRNKDVKVLNVLE